jgi:glycosyltransferase involved in cell wall biosynthesis
VTKARLLWCSDFTVHTGFARVAESVLRHLADSFDVGVLGTWYNGDPHEYPFPIWPAASGNEPFGFGRLKEVAGKFKPDVVLVLNDTYYVAKFAKLRAKLKADWKLVAYIPVDAPNTHPDIAIELNNLDAAICYTHFGLRELRTAGFDGKAAVIPHGIDRKLFRPVPRETARRELKLDGMPGWKEAFIVGNVGRNQPRKRLDLTIAYFADWVEREKLPPNVKLYLHCAVKDAHLVDVKALCKYFGVLDRLILTSPDIGWDKGIDERQMSLVYSAQDIHVQTTLGDGWNLPVMESMSCGVPQIVPEWSGLAEWARGAVEYVPCSEIQVFSGLENRIGGVPDREAFIAALSRLYRDSERREELSQAGLELVSRPEFEWPRIAQAFAGVINATLAEEAVSEPAMEEPIALHA